MYFNPSSLSITISSMQISDARYTFPPAVSSPQQTSNYASRNNLMWDSSRLQDKDTHRRDEVPPTMMRTPIINQDQPRHIHNSEVFCSSVMDPMSLKSCSRFDEGYERTSSVSSGQNSHRLESSDYLRSPVTSTRFQVHDKFQTILQAYDKEMLSKLDSRRKNDSRTPPSKYLRPLTNSSTLDISPTSFVTHENRIKLRPLSVPDMPAKSLIIDNPFNRQSERPSFTSPPSLFQSSSEIRPNDNTEYKIFSTSSFPSTSGGYQVNKDSPNFMSGSLNSSVQRSSLEREAEFREEKITKQPIIDEYSSLVDIYSPTVAGGKKRRAPSPTEDQSSSFYIVMSSNSSLRRRESATSRNSTGPHFRSQSGSISSTASDARKNSYASALSVNPNCIGSFGRLSPGVVSPGGLDCIESPSTSLSSNPSPPGSISRFNHQKNPSFDNRTLMTSTCPIPESASHTPLNRNMSNIQGIFMCECCPKKPKKFDAKEDLDAHEQEKQYECAYCRNRFKNKNEAERHQNSLHLRRHSWSCAALFNCAAAFHTSSTRPNEADTCGYCGEDFPRSGMDSGLPVTTEQDWNVRITHLTEIHKFRECNHAKKFFRADHFRQHLKHSHAGTSGKWTNMLENACMKDEPPPEPIRRSERVNQSHSRPTRTCKEKEIFQVEESLVRSENTRLRT
ncbi:hypothetical protein Golomagni_03498 [Golovinomyces magnicellulatus]|nr:hypothetical protein Golomagni_03498 [Golovinomyces magnicellulatus]